MFSKWQWILGHLTRALWLRATLMALLAIVVVFAAMLADRLLPFELPFEAEQNTLDNILNILASSMLAVTTFSLTVMVSAYSAATSNVTPRATKLIRQDTTTQNVLATFIGSFLFSLVGIIAVQTDSYGHNGRFVLFIATLVVIALIVITILRWIEHLSLLGRVGATTNRVEQEASQALRHYLQTPCLGGIGIDSFDQPPTNAIALTSRKIGYIQHIDSPALQDLAESLSLKLYLPAIPGAFVHEHTTIVWVSSEKGDPEPLSDEDTSKLLTCFTIDHERSYEQDPRFGLCVLAEIASRALSPAVNDPGTAIDIIGRGVRILSLWATTEKADTTDCQCTRLYVKRLHISDLLADLYRPIARDGAGLAEVQLRLQKALLALAQFPQPDLREAAIQNALVALEHAQQTLKIAADLKPLELLVNEIRSYSK